jgi:putative addiction module CopG family antidote
MATSASLGPRFERLIRYLQQIGRYHNRSEVLRAGLRLLEKHEYDLGYIYKEEQFKVLMSAYARFHNLEREKQFPRRSAKHEPIEDRTDDIVDAAREYVETTLDHLAELHANSPKSKLASDDST